MAGSNRPTNQETVDHETTSILALFLRLFWMFLGNIALGASALYMLSHRASIFSPADVVYAVSVPLLIVARYVDIARFKGDTAYGEPATLAHWRRYALSLLLGSIVAWVVIHGIGYVFMR